MVMLLKKLGLPAISIRGVPRAQVSNRNLGIGPPLLALIVTALRGPRMTAAWVSPSSSFAALGYLAGG